MSIASRSAALFGFALALSACEPLGSTQAYAGPESIIATGQDQGFDSGVLRNGEAAIAYDPDGCQNWIIDDGLEGYSTPRYDPVSGLPVCDGRFPPGTVIRPYQTESAGIADRVSGPGVRTVVRQ
jgi:hypothetical protein